MTDSPSDLLRAAVADLHAWLASLEASPRCQAPPAPEDEARLDALLQAVWRAGGQEAPGLVRGSPEQAFFRAEVGPFFWQSEVLGRCWEKPRGYAGDFLMMEAIYRREPAGRSPLGRWLDAWALELPGFQAVRNRRDAVQALLLAEHHRGARRVLNVACGSAPELALAAREVAFDLVTLLDQDQGALDAALAGLPPRQAAQPWCGSVLALLRNKSELPPLSQDVIYSIGLYDYLSERFARTLTQKLWDALRPGGLLVVGNFNALNPMHHFTESALDWYLIYRTPEELLRLTQGLPQLASAEVRTEPAGCLHLLLARKAG